MTTSRKHPAAVACLFAVLVANVAGCATPDVNGRALAVANRDVAALTADDVVRVMRRAGFDDEQILGLGTDLRNSLAATGAAHVVIDETVEAIIAVDGDRLHVASRRTGSFIYDLKIHAFR